MVEYFRAWIEALETFVLEVIFGERTDFKARLMRSFLLASSKLSHGGREDPALAV